MCREGMPVLSVAFVAAAAEIMLEGESQRQRTMSDDATALSSAWRPRWSAS